MSAKSNVHFLLVPAQAWGHIRPQCHLALALLACSTETVVTIISSGRMFEKTRAEIMEHASDSLDKSRMRILCTSKYDGTDMMSFFDSHNKSYPETYKILYEEKPIKCLATDITYEPFSAPAVVILDFAMSPILGYTRALTGRSVPIFTWGTGSLASIIRFWGPETMGGRGDIVAMAEAELQKTGGTLATAGAKIITRTEGKILSIPGLPPMYDHEFLPQEVAPEAPTFIIHRSGLEVFNNSDGVISSASSILEGDAGPAVHKWFSDSGRESYLVGPLLPSTFWTKPQSDQGATDVREFLEKMHVEHGDKSVVLVSFGTHFWPPVQEYIEEVIMAFIEKEVPFIFCHPSPFSKIPPALADAIASSGRGILSPWIPQYYVLTHPAVGFFLTHGGQGGVTEALASGVPLICWPINADQPAVAMQAAHVLGVAFELIEVRSGDGLKPIHRLGDRKPEGTREAVGREIREVIDAARGDVGREMRAKVEKIKLQLKQSWEEGGVASTALLEFVKSIQSKAAGRK